MNYINKYNKYYHKLKGGVDQTKKYYSLITDKIIYDNCEQPDFIRVLQHPVSKKLIILLGESHTYYEHRFTKKRFEFEYDFDRVNPDKGVDYILGQISKRISNAKDNLDDPFHKVLLLYEIGSTHILLGGKKEFEPDLLEIKDTDNSLTYIQSKFIKIFSKYRNVLSRKIDLRQTLNIEYCMFISIKQTIAKMKENPELSMKDIFIKVNDLFQDSMTNINKYIINDEPYVNIKQPIPPPFGDEENKKFFGESYTRKPYIFPRKLSEVFIHTQNLYSTLKELFIETVNVYNKNPNILINSAFDHLNDDDRLILFYNNINQLNILITRIMDLYTIEYIHLMDNNTATVVYTGGAHSRFLFNELIVIEDYEILEIENINYIHNFNLDEQNKCERVFPSFNTNLDKLNSNYKNIKNMYFTESNIDYKQNFIKNMLLMTYTSNIPVISNLELQLGYWEDIMAMDPLVLFTLNKPYY